jgi:NTP pyrophosphatase (non-canonical NTP hydrolase)
MDIKKLQDLIITFREKRDRKKFHNPKDLSASIAIEAWELQEKFLRKSTEESYEIWRFDPEVADELADIVNNVLLLAEVCKIDISQACVDKIKQNESKYPISKSKGKCTKYNKL